MKTCKNCKHWDDTVSHEAWDGIGWCKAAVGGNYMDDPPKGDSKMFAVDSGNYSSASLHTKPDHHCGEWAAREN